MRPVFSRPYPLSNLDTPDWMSALCLGAFIGLFIFIFEPFGLSQVNPPAWYLLGYGPLSGLVFWGHQKIFPALFPQFWSEEKWTVGREILDKILLLSLIALCNHLYEKSIFGLLHPDWAYSPNLALMMVNVVFLGIFPIFAFTLIAENRMLRKNLKEAEHFNAQLREREGKEQAPLSAAPANDLLRIDSDNQHEVLQLALSELRYISSDANYIDVIWVKEGELQRSTLRSSLKKVTEDHGVHPHLMRCHRTYFINLHSLQSVSGNSRGYKLKLRDVAEDIPVSRSYIPQLRRYLEEQSLPL